MIILDIDQETMPFQIIYYIFNVVYPLIHQDELTY